MGVLTPQRIRAIYGRFFFLRNDRSKLGSGCWEVMLYIASFLFLFFSYFATKRRERSDVQLRRAYIPWTGLGVVGEKGKDEIYMPLCTRNVLTFVNTTAIAWCQDPRKKAEFWRYAIAVVFTNVRTLRVCERNSLHDWLTHLSFPLEASNHCSHIRPTWALDCRA